ncbi:hypothetical protein CAPTEDRAFT_220419 [Capitella teleta]|uniref:Uncharacterized protein n=1 Tax=Capitella teleta TaxID=283909 RepID=R7V5G9_CAPTE|nr:hypothetical protein CAPTEDRAFT_220419 [Capitella teleta]|eukprot:ELU13687.1 hypothetical protein CAPTEDRAFT_220419 [Capitella teleta]
MNSEQVGGYMIDKSAAVITDEILQDLNEENLPVEEDEMDSAAEDGEEDEERRGEEDEEEVPIESEVEENHDGESKEDVMKFTLSSLDKLIKDARRNSTGNPVVEEEVNEPDEKVDDREGMGAESAELMEVESNSPPSKISPKKSSSLSSVAGSSPMKVARKSISPVKNAIKSPVKSPMKDATLVELHSDEASKRTSPVKSPRKILTPKFDQAAKSTESPDKMKEEKGESFTAIKSPDSLPSSKKMEGKPSSERVPTPMRRSSRKRQSIIPDLAAVTEYEESSSGQENTNNSNGIFDLGSESEWSPKGMGSKARNMLQHIKSSKVTTPTKKRRVSLSEEVKDPQVSLRRINTRTHVDSMHAPKICECDSPKETKKGCDSSRRRSMPAAKMGALDSPAAAASPAKSRRQSMEPTRRSQRLRQK